MKIRDDSLAPLTHLVRLWLPEWLAVSATAMIGAWAVIAWWNPFVSVAAVGAAVCVNEHWRKTYERFVKVQQGEEIQVWPKSKL